MPLQVKIILVLVSVILPLFLLITIAENQLTKPLLSEEMKQIGITVGKSLASDILAQRELSASNPTLLIERNIQELLYFQPSIVRVDVFVKDPKTEAIKNIASNIDEDPSVSIIPVALTDITVCEFKRDESGLGVWDVFIPIRSQKKILGNVHVVVSLKVVDHLLETLWKIKVGAAAFSVILLIFLLNYFLKKTISNDRLLTQAKSQNLVLTEQLHEVQQQLVNTEKLAVMGQLTASFAHETGTPLNAIGGHLQLLKEELSAKNLDFSERFEIIEGQLVKIEKTVKNFLQSTSKPLPQKQLVDLNEIVQRTLSIVYPRILLQGVNVNRKLNEDLVPVRAVPLDLEQILLNLVNNSLDALRHKKSKTLSVSTQKENLDGRSWAAISIYDTGEGIKKEDLKNVTEPFFTTKRPEEGTGLGLAICKELIKKQSGKLKIESKEGAWTRVTVQFPYPIYEDTRSG